MQLLYIKNVTGYFETFIELPFRFFEQKKTPITGVLSGYICRVYWGLFLFFLNSNNIFFDANNAFIG